MRVPADWGQTVHAKIGYYLTLELSPFYGIRRPGRTRSKNRTTNSNSSGRKSFINSGCGRRAEGGGGRTLDEGNT